MRLALLVSNTDDSAFARAHPRDPEKFRSLIASVRPDWTVTPFEVWQGLFPDGLAGFDGAIIGGSPASVNAEAGWIRRLEALTRDMIAARFPLFGVCFGHQLIARALGANVVPNPHGYMLGAINARVETPPFWLPDPPAEVRGYAANSEQVDRVPPGCARLLSAQGCAVAGLWKDYHLVTIQFHPEMSDAFIGALIEELAPEVGERVADAARDSLRQPADRSEFARWMAAFFEQATEGR